MVVHCHYCGRELFDAWLAKVFIDDWGDVIGDILMILK